MNRTPAKSGYHCGQCGMCLKGPNDYHPYAACMMFGFCHDGNQVQANLDAVVEYGRKSAEGTPVTAGAVMHQSAKDAASAMSESGRIPLNNPDTSVPT